MDKEEREILSNEEQKLYFILNVGIMKGYKLSMTYKTQLISDKSN